MMFKDKLLEQIVINAKAGDEIALNELATLADKRLSIYFQRKCNNKQDAEDLTQETLLKMYRCLEGLCQVSRFWSWLFTIAANIKNSYYRKVCRQGPSQSIDFIDESSDVVKASKQQSSLEEMVSKEKSLLITEAIDQLKERSKFAITNRYFLRQGYDKISSDIGCSETIARSIVHRARQKLKIQFQKQDLLSA